LQIDVTQFPWLALQHYPERFISFGAGCSL